MRSQEALNQTDESVHSPLREEEEENGTESNQTETVTTKLRKHCIKLDRKLNQPDQDIHHL